jgi:hypothetical protein
MTISYFWHDHPYTQDYKFVSRLWQRYDALAINRDTIGIQPHSITRTQDDATRTRHTHRQNDADSSIPSLYRIAACTRH